MFWRKWRDWFGGSLMCAAFQRRRRGQQVPKMLGRLVRWQPHYVGPAGLCDSDGKMIGPSFQRVTFLGCIGVTVVGADQLRRQGDSGPPPRRAGQRQAFLVRSGRCGVGRAASNGQALAWRRASALILPSRKTHPCLSRRRGGGHGAESLAGFSEQRRSGTTCA
jgi:hypothetical protein